jgi:rubrerythrin
MSLLYYYSTFYRVGPVQPIVEKRAAKRKKKKKIIPEQFVDSADIRELVSRIVEQEQTEDSAFENVYKLLEELKGDKAEAKRLIEFKQREAKTKKRRKEDINFIMLIEAMEYDD